MSTTTIQQFQEARHASAGNIPPSVKQVKTLIWIYFWLIIFEGSLRKWVLPGLSDPLLIIRDPLVLLIYLQAIQGDFFPKHWLVKTTIALGCFTFLWGCIHIYSDGSYKMLLVTLYGVRTYFLHLPLIFVIGHVFTRDDVIKTGKWCLVLSIPMAVLMAAQYSSSADHILNRATQGEDSRQIIASMGKIRPAGTFSFATGPAVFIPLAAAYLLYGITKSKTYPFMLLLCAGSAIILTLPISGSRTTILSVGFVVFFTTIALLRTPSLLARFAIWLSGILVCGLFLITLPIGKEAVESFSARWEQAADSEGGGAGAGAAISNRLSGSFLEVFELMDFIPITGFGIGAGTNVGVKIMTGGVGFLYGEAEWTRNVMEAGPILGFIYIGFRLLFAGFLLRLAWNKLSHNDILPWLIISCAVVHLIMGQTSQPTTLGFMCFIAGLSLSSVGVMARHVPLSENRRRWLAQQERIHKAKPGGGILTADGRSI